MHPPNIKLIFFIFDEERAATHPFFGMDLILDQTFFIVCFGLFLLLVQEKLNSIILVFHFIARKSTDKYIDHLPKKLPAGLNHFQVFVPLNLPLKY